MRKIVVSTKKAQEVVNITPVVEKLLKEHPAKDGLVHLFLKHTTAALTTAYIEDDLDLIGAYEVIIPLRQSKSMHEHGEHTHHEGHLPAHVVGSLLGPQLIIPVKKNKLDLGDFQSVALVELKGPRKREIVAVYEEA